MTLEQRISALAAAIGADIKLLGGASPDIAAIDNLTGTGLIERTGDGTADLVTITAAGKALLDDPNTATQRTTLGLGNVDNTADADKPISTATQAALNGKQDALVSGTNIKTVAGKSVVGSGNVSLVKSDVGLGNVDNTSDASKPISSATQTALDAKVSTSLVGASNGIAPLDATGKVASTYLPSYVDDVLEYANLAGFPGTGETGKIYTALDSNKIYRWSGSVYVEISASPGSTDAVTEGASNLYFTGARVLATLLAGLSTATNATIVATDSVLSALGKLQKQIADNLSTLTSHTGNTSNPHSTTKAQVGLGNVDNTSDASKPISTATQTALDAKANTTGGNASGTWPIGISGNAATATSASTASTGYRLASPNGTSVVTADTAFPDAGATLIHTLGYGPGSNDGHILAMSWTGTGSYGAQLFLDTDPTNTMAIRSRSSGGVWNGWSTVLHTDNYTTYTIPASAKGTANGVAPLDASGKVPSANLPSASGVTNGKAFFFKS